MARLTEKTIDLRYPEQCSAQPDAMLDAQQLASIKDLDQQYRREKKRRSALEKTKRHLSRELHQHQLGDEHGQLLQQKMSQVKDELALSKSNLNAISAQLKAQATATPKESQAELPSQFAIADQGTESSDAQPLRIELSQDDNEWDHYIGSHPNTTLYHSSAIRNVIVSSFQHVPFYLTAKDHKSAIVGVLPLIRLRSRLFGDFLCSLPLFNYGGPLTDNSRVTEQLCSHAAELASTLGCDHIEYRDCQPRTAFPVRRDKVTMLLTLPPDHEALWQSLGSKLRAQIRKAQRYSPQVTSGRQELLKDFYRVFSRNMRDLGTPVYPRHFFRNMLDHIPASHIHVVYLQRQPVAAGFTLGWRNTLEIPWASALRSANPYNVNMLLYWHILQFAIDQNYRVFDFGRTSRESSTHRFKKQWGAKEQPLYWHYWLATDTLLPMLNPGNPKYRLLIAIWQRLPVWCTNLCGPLVARYLP